MVVNAQQCQPLAARFGFADVSSSDGQAFLTAGRGEALGAYNARHGHGREPSALFYTCELVLDGTVVTASVVMNEIRRLVAPGQPIMLNVPDMLKLQIEPLADCGRYDHLREVSHVVH